MFEKLLNKPVIQSKYRDDLFTYEVQFDISQPPILLDLEKVEHNRLKFLDEMVLIHEPVTVFLKTEKELLNEGWQPWGKSSLILKDSEAFKIGKEKAKLLGKQLKGRIGITRQLQPFFFDLNNHWRFSEKEIKLILKDLFNKKENKEISVKSGTYQYKANTNTIIFPTGRSMPSEQLNELRLVLKEFNLI